MKAALIGMMQAGKSSILSVVSGKKPQLGGATKMSESIVPVPDERIDWLDGLYKPKKKIYATVDCLDVPGLSFIDNPSRTAARRHLSEVRTVDMLVLIVRAYDDPTVPAYRGKVDPMGELGELLSEILLADMEMVVNRIERLEKKVMRATVTLDNDKRELQLQQKLLSALEDGKPVRHAISSEMEREVVKPLGFFTMKPIAVVINVGEDQLDTTFDISNVTNEDVPCFSVCAKLEQELASLDEESRIEFMNDLGIKEVASNKFVNNCYSAMGLISFLTVGSDEVRAWPIRNGTIALNAAAKVHSDIQRGFIRAETISYDDLREFGDEKSVKAAGKARLEGKTYIVKDGDIIDFRFNV